MIEPEYLGLIHKSIDESISADEQEKLQHYMEKNPQAQQVHDDLLNVAKGLSALEELEPSPNLKKYIMNRIPAGKYAPREKGHFLSRLFGSRPLQLHPKLGYAFAAGLIAGFLLMVLVAKIYQGQPVLNIEDLQGTLAPEEKSPLNESSEAFTINLPEVSGKVQVQYWKEKVWLELYLRSEQEIEIFLSIPETGIRFSGFFPGDAANCAFFVKNRGVTLIHHGDNHYRLLFDRSGQTETAIKFSILQNSSGLLDKQIFIEPQ